MSRGDDDDDGAQVMESAGMLIFDELLELLEPADAIDENEKNLENEDDDDHDDDDNDNDDNDINDNDIDDNDHDHDHDGFDDEEVEDVEDISCDVCDKTVSHTDRVLICTESDCKFCACQRCLQRRAAKVGAHPHALKESFNFTFAYRLEDTGYSVRRVTDTHGALTLLLLSTEPNELNLIRGVRVSPPIFAADVADTSSVARLFTIRHAKVGDIEWLVEGLDETAVARLVEKLRQFHTVELLQ